MKIAVTSTGPTLNDSVEPRFGRCPYFLIVETDDLSFEAIENPNVSLGGGAGIQSGQVMSEHGVKYVLTGNCGPNAHRTLAAGGIGIITGCSGRVRDVIDQYKSGQLSETNQPNVPSHFGTGGGGGGMGGGMGRGRGMGMGMGRGQGLGFGNEPPMVQPQSTETSESELSDLKEQAETMKQQMELIQQRIQGIEDKEKNG